MSLFALGAAGLLAISLLKALLITYTKSGGWGS